MTRGVLIVDDSLTVRMDLAQAFDAADFTTFLAASIAEARTHFFARRPALVVLDVRLPDGDGIDLLRELREVSSSTPVMLLSSEAEVRDRIHGIRTGADEYIGKPYDIGYVIARARQLVGEASDSGEHKRLLVIDDSVTFREGVRSALEQQGFAVTVAASGEEGLGIAAHLRPTAIIVDGVLPGIDGSTVIRRVRLDAALRRTPCLLLTASEGPEGELRALDAGADAYVRKEHGIEMLLARLDAMLRSAEHRAVAPATDSALGPKRILAVDDSETFLAEVTAALQGESYDVVCARSGEQALELLAVQTVDCILLDLSMPGLGGERTCQTIKAAPGLRELPLIMLTSHDDHASMIAGLAAGADDYLTKSDDFEVLRARVRAQIRRRQFEDENRRFREQILRMEMEAAEAAATRELAELRASMVEELERKNRELEAFSYSVSHDLRAPLRAIEGFSEILVADYAPVLDATARGYIDRVVTSARRMTELIDDLLSLSRLGRAELRKQAFDLSALAQEVIADLRAREPDRTVECVVEPELGAEGDVRLVRVVLENLLGNAWKFTAKQPAARIELSGRREDGRTIFFVHDNGAGFDMKYAAKLFGPFQRLHSAKEFAGTGIGLATVHRIVERHGGRVWAEGEVGQGATIFFTLGSGNPRRRIPG